MRAGKLLRVSHDERYLVAIATYGRPRELARLLDSLIPAVEGRNVEVLVVDNDADAPARDVVSNHPLRVRHVVEADPGIPCARNRALAQFTDEFAGILFVDDDEWVDENWIRSITGYASRSRAGVVMGAVVTVLPDTAPAWMREGGWYQRPVPASGTPLKTAATNNTLLMRSAWVAAGCPRFDVAYTSTGGSDTDLFTAIHRAGVAMEFCAEAVVFEDIPDSRLSLRWLCRRYVRHGITAARVHRKYGQPLLADLCIAAGSSLIAVIQLGLALVVRRGRDGEPRRAILNRFVKFTCRRTFQGFGLCVGLVGYRIHEYRRQDATIAGDSASPIE